MDAPACRLLLSLGLKPEMIPGPPPIVLRSSQVHSRKPSSHVEHGSMCVEQFDDAIHDVTRGPRTFPHKALSGRLYECDESQEKPLGDIGIAEQCSMNAKVKRETGMSREESSQVQLSAGLGSPASGRARQDYALPRPEGKPAMCQNLSSLSSPLANNKCRLET